MNKRGNPYYNQVVKVSSKNVRCLPDYENRMKKKTNNQEFESKPNWFEHISPCVVKHRNNDNTYFMYETFENQSIRNEYIHNGQPIEKEVIQPFLPTYNEREVQVFTMRTDNIKKFSFFSICFINDFMKFFFPIYFFCCLIQVQFYFKNTNISKKKL